MRKIDADALTDLFRSVIRDIAKNPKVSKDEEHIVRASAMTIEMIADAPTIEDDTICECNLAENAALVCEILNADADGKVADLVKVVRCKDCAYLNISNSQGHKFVICDRFDRSTIEDGFCNFGTKKD